MASATQVTSVSEIVILHMLDGRLRGHNPLGKAANYWLGSTAAWPFYVRATSVVKTRKWAMEPLVHLFAVTYRYLLI